MRTVIATVATAALLAPVGALARQHDPAVHVHSVVRTDQQTQVDRRTETRSLARVERARVVQNRRDYREEQSETISRSVKAAEIDLSNLAGDITITRGGSSVQVEAVKIARGRTVEEAREMLALVTVQIAERGPRAEVRTVYPRHEERDRERRNINVTVRYNVTAPEGTRVSARSLSGSISVTDIKGDINATTLSGDVRIVNGARVMSAKSTSGDVDIVNLQSPVGLDAGTVSGSLTVRNSTAPRLRLNSVSGDIVISASTSGRVDARTVSGNVEFTAPLEQNGRYELNSHSGDIRIIPTNNTGFELDANSFSGNIRSEITLKDTRQGGGDFNRRGPGGRSRSLQGVFGDGSAILDVSTFSGTVIVGRK